MPRRHSSGREAVVAEYEKCQDADDDWGDGSFDDYDDLEPEYHPDAIYDYREDGPDESARAWAPLATMVSKLCHLTDLIYACENQFPACLLQVCMSITPPVVSTCGPFSFEVGGTRRLISIS